MFCKYILILYFPFFALLFRLISIPSPFISDLFCSVLLQLVHCQKHAPSQNIKPEHNAKGF